jgi:hypothetical protein
MEPKRRKKDSENLRLQNEVAEWKEQANEALILLESMKETIERKELQIESLEKRLEMWSRLFTKEYVLSFIVENFDPEILYEELLEEKT